MFPQHSSVSNNEVFPGGYEIFRKDRMSVNLGGGVFIAIHSTILATHQANLGSATEEVCQAKTSISSIRLYRLPGNQEELLDELEKSLLSLQSKGYPRVVNAGDFNVPDIKWDQLSISSNAQYGLSLNQDVKYC